MLPKGKKSRANVEVASTVTPGPVEDSAQTVSPERQAAAASPRDARLDVGAPVDTTTLGSLATGF